MNSETEVRVLVCGDRRWDDHFIMGIFLGGLLVRYGQRLVIVEGEAAGADTMAREWALANGLTVANRRLRKYPAKWGQFGRRGKGDPAGPIRNREMLKKEDPHFVLAFHNDITKSVGTGDMLEIAEKAGKYWALVGSHRPHAIRQTLPL